MDESLNSDGGTMPISRDDEVKKLVDRLAAEYHTFHLVVYGKRGS